MLEYASGVEAIKIGKPYQIILDILLEEKNLKKEDLIFVGDNLETDIKLGYDAKIETIMVCSGVHTEKDIERLKVYPTKVIKNLEKKKPVVVCGDLNVAHKEIDLKNPKTNRRNAGFTDEERGKFTELLDSGFIDTFRYFYPNLEQVYSWWSYRGRARENNAGWRIDYFVVSKELEKNLVDAEIHTQIEGSDHCPVVLFLDLDK